MTPAPPPFKTKVVEPIELPSPQERERALEAAGYATMLLQAQDVYIDLLTDSGTSAMSDAQWSALMLGDESYAGSRSFRRFEDEIRAITGFEHVLPVHQGRAAEHVLFGALVTPGSHVLANALFDTTRAHVAAAGGVPLDLAAPGTWDVDDERPFKGDVDLVALEAFLSRRAGEVAFVCLTVLNNLGYSQPVSMANIAAASELARRFGVPLFLDAARFAENAYFIKRREDGYGERSVEQIAREMFSHADGCWVSAKKDGLVNIGGVLALRDDALAQACQARVILYEGYWTYGGLARRDLLAIARGLREGLDERYLAHRVRQIEFLCRGIRDAGVRAALPPGGSAVYLDAAALYPQLPVSAHPNTTFCAELYRIGGVRAAGGDFVVSEYDIVADAVRPRELAVTRLALPRRVYAYEHLEYVIDAVAQVVAAAPAQRGFERTSGEGPLAHFHARYTPRVKVGAARRAADDVKPTYHSAGRIGDAIELQEQVLADCERL